MSTHPFIQHLEVKNLGLFDNLEVSFTPGINIIIGPNASGKTSILRAITYCFNGQSVALHKFQEDTSFGITINEGNGSSFMAGWNGLREKNETYHNTGITVVGHSYPKPSYSPFPGEVPYNLLAIGAHRFFDYTNVEFVKKEEDASRAKRNYDQNNPAYMDKPGLPSLKQWMVNRYFQIDKDWAEVERSNWRMIIDRLSILSPNENEFYLKEIGRDLEPQFVLDGKVCYLEELSSGFKSILSIVFSIVQWIELVNKDEKRLIQNAEGTVLIDEIDSHLHPSWQAQIMHALRRIFPSLQFIVTTHSPLVMSTIRNSAKDSIQEIVYKKDEGYRCEKIQTYGNDASSIIAGTLDSIPRDVEADAAFSNLYNLIDMEQYEDAQARLSELKEIYGELPELIQAQTMLTFLKPKNDCN